MLIETRNFISTTEDIWSYNNTSYLGMAGHFILIRCITTRLSGKALEIIKYRLIKWVYIRKYLEETFESQYSATSLQLQINWIKMNQGKTVNAYTDRIEKLFFKLCHIYTLNKSEVEAKIIQEQILALYIEGLIKQIKIMVKTRNPITLKEAKSIANTE